MACYAPEMTKPFCRLRRTSHQLRPVRIEPHYSRYAEGSVLVCMGNTHVVCTASVENDVPRFLKGKGTGWVTAEYGMLPRSTHTRMAREVNKGKVSGRTAEIQRLIGRSIRSIVDFNLLGERTIHLDCDVLQADGGTRTASITGAYVATALACDYLIRNGILDVTPLREAVAAVSLGVVHGKLLLDLEYEEDSSAEVDMNLVMTASGKIVEIQGTAETEPFSHQVLNKMITLGARGIHDLLRHQQKAIRNGTRRRHI